MSQRVEMRQQVLLPWLDGHDVVVCGVPFFLCSALRTLTALPFLAYAAPPETLAEQLQLAQALFRAVSSLGKALLTSRVSLRLSRSGCCAKPRQRCPGRIAE